MKLIGMALLLVGASSFAVAFGPAPVPEIETTSAAGALCLLSGAVLVYRARRK
jgi:hypothetical protein